MKLHYPRCLEYIAQPKNLTKSIQFLTLKSISFFLLFRFSKNYLENCANNVLCQMSDLLASRLMPQPHVCLTNEIEL